MNSETKVCQNCHQDFIIEPEDFDFYKKIDVPAPTFCPDCRLQRRMSWRNERTFYKGKCAATGKDFLTMFSPEAKMTVYDRDYWWSDNWDQLATGREYDFSKPFFVQFAELMRQAPLPNLANSNCVRTDYGNHSLNCKDCYLIHASAYSENVAYATGVVEVKDSFDIYKMLNGEQCYEVVLSGSNNKVFFAYNSDQNLESSFLLDSHNMQQSLGCVNMKNHSYCILNKQYSKDDYQVERAKIDLGSFREFEAFKRRFSEFTQNVPRRYAAIVNCSGVTGSHIINSKNSKNCFDGYGNVVDCKYMYHVGSSQESYDSYGVGAVAELMYEAVDAGDHARACKFAVFTHSCQDTQYTYSCHGSSNLFGCVGLLSKQYCILNKQYTKEEYEALVPKIIEHMEKMPYVDSSAREYGYGEFFPVALSPFAYNETIAQEYVPLNKKNATENGFSWREIDQRRYVITKKNEQLPDHIKDVDEEILKEVIECAHKGQCNQQCTGAFRIISSELIFLKHFNLILPRLCPNCRHYERLKQRTPFKLWKRACQCGGVHSQDGKYMNTSGHSHGASKCVSSFETPYAPDRPEIVYCETCYQQEVV